MLTSQSKQYLIQKMMAVFVNTVTLKSAIAVRTYACYNGNALPQQFDTFNEASRESKQRVEKHHILVTY